MSFGFLPDWTGCVPREGGHVVTVRGGGGKTALIEAMTDVLVAEGVPVAIVRDGADTPLDWSALERCPLGSLSSDHACLHVVAPDGGTDGLPPHQVDDLGRTLPDHVVFYEADSGAGRSVVGTTADALPARTSLLITVCGLDAVDRPVETVLPDGPVPPEWLTEADGRTVWSWDGLVGWFGALPLRPAGAHADVPHIPALLMMDECIDSIGLFAALGRLTDELGHPLVILGDTSGPTPRLRTACVLESGADE